VSGHNKYPAAARSWPIHLHRFQPFETALLRTGEGKTFGQNSGTPNVVFQTSQAKKGVESFSLESLLPFNILPLSSFFIFYNRRIKMAKKPMTNARIVSHFAGKFELSKRMR
jgi:hypothetical protein